MGLRTEGLGLEQLERWSCLTAMRKISGGTGLRLGLEGRLQLSYGRAEFEKPVEPVWEAAEGAADTQAWLSERGYWNHQAYRQYLS